MRNERMVAEASERIMMLHYQNPNKLEKLFREKAVVFMAKCSPENKDFPIMLHCPTQSEQELIDKFEENGKYLVYHALISKGRMGTVYLFLYVPENEDAWNADRQQLTSHKDAEKLLFPYHINDDRQEIHGLDGKSDIEELMRIHGMAALYVSLQENNVQPTDCNTKKQ